MMLTMMSRASWNLRSILGIDEDAQTISLDATIRFQWRDSRVGRHPSNGLEKNATFFFKVKGLPQTGDHVTITPRGNSATDITKVFSHMLKSSISFMDSSKMLWMPDFFLDRAKVVRENPSGVLPAASVR